MTPTTPWPEDMMPWPEDILVYQPLVAAVAGEFKGVSAFDRDDLLSEGMIGLAKGLCRGGGSKSDPVAFLKTSARNAMKSWLSWRDGASRRSGLRRWRGANDGPLGWMQADVIEEGQIVSLLAAIEGEDHLTPHEREILTAFFGVGVKRLEPREIATSMGIARETVHRVRLRAVTKLRASLGGDDSVE